MSNLDLEELLSIPLFYLFKVDHAKEKVSFYWDKTGRMELYVMDLETKKIEQETDGELPKDIKTGYIWARDNETIVYGKDDTGAEENNIYAFNIRTKENISLSEEPGIQEHIVDSSPDGEWYIFNSLRNGQLNIYKMRTDGSDIQQLTAHDNPAYGGSISPDGKWVAYVTNEEADYNNFDIYLVDTDGEEIKQAVQLEVGSKEYFYKWAPDSKSFAFRTDRDGMNRPGIYHLETGEVRLLGEEAYNEYPTTFSKDGSKLFCLVNNEASITPSVYDLTTGERMVFDFPKGIAEGGEITKEDHLLMSLNRPESPSEIVMFDPDTQNIESLLKTDLGSINADLFVDNDYVTYNSTGGAEIRAMVYKPSNWDASKKNPGIIVPHGGPTSQYFHTFNAMAQYYIDNGYVVMYPNVRGSIGYGKEFRDSTIKDWGGKDLEDWVRGRQYLIDHYNVNPDRVAITGISYGGYATLISVGKRPDLWKVGAAIVPITDLLSLYEKNMPHFKYLLHRLMGDPVDDKKLWKERSPITYADQVQAKLLLLQGENDPRCPVNQSRDYVAALKESGKVEGEDFEYVEIKDQGHGMFSDRESRIRDAKIVTNFIMQNL